MDSASPLGQSLSKIGTLLFCSLVFLLIPLKIGSYGYMPPDDALRHAAFAVDGRQWHDVLVLNKEIAPEMDSHPGWHAFLRFLYVHLDFSATDLVFFSLCAAFVAFTASGLIVSSSPVAWLLACVLTMLVEGGLFSRLLLGRPFAISIAAFVALLFTWARERPLKAWAEITLTIALLTLTISVHPTVWYMWAAPGFVLLLCRRFRSLFILAGSLPVAMVLAALLTNNWYSVFVFPVYVILNAFGSDYLLITSLVTEFQPSGGPVMALIAVAGLLAVKHFKGYPLRDEFRSVDFCLLLLMWVLGLKVVRFWADWGIPAFTVWSCRQIILLKFDRLPRSWETLVLSGVAAVALYLGVTADLGGRYTQNLKSPLLTKPVEDYVKYLPDEGGVLYCLEMQVFYRLYFRLPHAKFLYQTGYEPGMMPPEDLKIMRGIQFNDGLLDAYKPWLEKMTEKDRILLFYPRQPEWAGMKFDQFYTMWIGRKLTAAEAAKVKTDPQLKLNDQLSPSIKLEPKDEAPSVVEPHGRSGSLGQTGLTQGKILV